MQSSQRAATLIANAIMAIILQGPRLRCRDLFTSILLDLDLEGDLPRVVEARNHGYHFFDVLGAQNALAFGLEQLIGRKLGQDVGLQRPDQFFPSTVLTLGAS